MCRIASLFLLQRLKEDFRRRAGLQNMETRAGINLISCKARRPRKFTPFWQKHLLNMHHRMLPPRFVWLSLNVVIFHLSCASSWTTQNRDHPGYYLSNSRSNLGRPPDLGWSNSWATELLMWAVWFNHSWMFEICESSPRSGSRNAWRRIKNFNVASLLIKIWNFFLAI